MRLIDADKLLRDIEHYHLSDGKFQHWVEIQSTIERKTGKWEERKVSSEKVIDEWQSARCSECGRYHTTPYMYYFDDYSYCPNCGADMR